MTIQVCIPAPELRGASLELGACKDLEVCLDGPAGTGKTIGALYKVHVILSRYPGAKALVARKSNTDLAGSAMATYRDFILDPREGVRYFGGNKVKPSAFEYPNGSLLIVTGLDRASKVKSYEFDIAYLNEATEVELEDLEFVRSRLRNGKGPYHQLMMDVNPDYPMHWLNQRMNNGITTRLLSRHEDNPRYFDLKTNDWTPAGRDYIFGVLEGLTGVRYKRLRLGQWCSAEGSVYEDVWDRKEIVVTNQDIPHDWPRYLAIDFGYTHPFVALWAAVDPDGRIYIYRQIYKTKTLVEDHAKEIKRLSRWGEDKGDPLPRAIICDHDAEGRATLEKYLGFYTIKAKKNVSEGIQAVTSRLRPSGDGKRRLFILSNSLSARDPELMAQKKPCSLEEEPDSYVWDQSGGRKHGEEPVKEYDHALDALRYLVAHLDFSPTAITYSNRIY